MKIHSDTITYLDVRNALQNAVVYADVDRVGSRKRDHGFNVYLYGSSPYAAQHDRTEKAATWDEWGVFLDYLFEIDPQMIAGQYDGRDDFERQTREAVEHNKRYAEIVGRPRPNMTAPWLEGVRA